ncbi:hypothetical protein NDN08_006831 [Rhodosorus marinus]|uniref:Shq1 C-terminal domain-containing protein n=1 Tax=Rhodosorus marinus TaxID=101924 RepID=A0AAV8UP73_9RHOD|nr:hypothetical protein NDN08_006831 [Rhodosorus marinus]
MEDRDQQTKDKMATAEDVKAHVEGPGAEKDSCENPEHTFGFNNRFSNLFSGNSEPAGLTLNQQYPADIANEHRSQMRRIAEDEKFDPEYYVADFRMPDEAEDYIAFTLEIRELEREEASEELEMGSDLPLPVEESSINRCLYGLSDLIFAFLHECRITEGEFNVESALTISQLSATLSCFATYESLDEAIVTSFRRSLAYTLCRNFKLAVTVLDNLKSVVRSGRKAMLGCLVRLWKLFDEDEDWEILKRLYINDYYRWIKSLDSETIEAFAEDLEKVQVRKADLGWDIESIEELVLEG